MMDNKPSCFAGLGELFWGFQRFQLLFSRIFPAFGLDWGAVLAVLWITATQARPVSYQHMAIVHYANLVWGISCRNDEYRNRKNDGSYWICGEGVGTEQKTVSGETEYTVICSSKFVPYEFPANEFSK